MSRGAGPYQIQTAKAAERGLERIPKKDGERRAAGILELADDPRPHGTEKIKGRNDLYRIRSGDYCVVYRINDGRRLIEIEAIGHRKDIYCGY